MAAPHFFRPYRRLRLPTSRKLVLSIGAVAAVAGLLLIARRRPTETHADAPPASQESLEDAARCQLVSPGPAGYSMRDLLLTWPPSKPRGLIYVTVGPGLAVVVIHLLQNIYANFNSRFDYPVVIFSESPGAADVLRESIARLGHDEASRLGQVFFYNISRFWEPPPNIMALHGNSVDKLIKHSYGSIIESGCPFTGNLGYWLACRFQSKGLTEIPFVQGFEYMWRLDVDSSLCEELPFDIFTHMKENDYWLGYLIEDSWDSCASFLTETVHSYVDYHNVIPAQGKDSIKDARAQYIYNNFEIFKVQFYQSREYRHYIDFIDRSGGFFYYRWCDGPVKTQAYRIFMPKKKMREFKVGEIFYQHQSFNRCRKL